MTTKTKAIVDGFISQNLMSEDSHAAIHGVGENGLIEADGYLDLGELADLIEASCAAIHCAGHFDICKAIAKENGDIQMAPLDNIVNLKKVKSGTNVTIGVAGDLVAAIGLHNKYIGGLLLIDREEYFAMKARLESGDSPQGVPDGTTPQAKTD